MEPDEIDAIKAVQQGQKESFRLLVSLHKNLVFGLVMRLVRHHSTAEDLSQEVFIKAFQGIGSFRFEAEFATWLRNITLNHVNSYFTSKKYKKQKITTNDEIEVETSELNLEEQAIYRQQAEFLLDCLALLKQKFRDALVLNVFEGLSYEAVAKSALVPIGTVRSRINTARILLADCLAEKT